MNQTAYDIASEMEELIQQHKGVTQFFWFSIADCKEMNPEALEAMAASIHKEATKIDSLMSQYFDALQAA